MKKVAEIRYVVLVNLRDKSLMFKDKRLACNKILCVKVVCTKDQFLSGLSHKAVLEGAKQKVSEDGDDSWENYDLMCFDEHESKEFISKKIWKHKNWKKSPILDLSVLEEFDENLTDDV